MSNETTLTVTDRARAFMIEELNAQTLCWEVPGPEYTSVYRVQCWAIVVDDSPPPRHRLVIVEIYADGGFDVFPQILSPGIKATAEAIRNMNSIESA